MSDFNARAARGKRPCPIWVDAFQRDTQHLQADEIGAYFLILMAMWTRESCDFPDDDLRLARVSRVSTRLWRSRIGPMIREFLITKDGMLTSKKLREEAAYAESVCQAQSDRSKGSDNKSSTYTEPTGTRKSNKIDGEKTDKPLINNKPTSTTDISTDDPRTYPTQLPNYPTVDNDGGDAGARTREAENPEKKSAPDLDLTDREKLLVEMGHKPDSGIAITANGKMIGTMTDMREYQAWRDDLDLTWDEVIGTITEVMARRPDPDPPISFRYFTKAMQRTAADKTRPKLEPAEETRHERPASARAQRSEQHHQFDATLRETINRLKSGEINFGP